MNVRHSSTDQYLVPLDVYIADHRKALADLEWDDPDHHSVEALQRCIDHALKLLQNGDRYYPLF